MTIINHAERSHALLSASSASRWLKCTPSAVINDNLPEETSEFAMEGTQAHEIAEKVILAQINGSEEPIFEGDDLRIREELEPYVQRVIDTYRTLEEENGQALIFPEMRVDYGNYAPEGFGTSDVIIISGETIYVIDLKFGRGVEVSAVENPQMRLYALGALGFFKNMYNLEKVVTRIDQPRIFNFSEEEISVSDLVEWGSKVVKPLAEKAFKGEGELVVGDHCRFCKAAATCPAKAQKELALVEQQQALPDVELLTLDQVAEILTKGKDLATWLAKVEDYALKQALAGESVPGYKVVEGRAYKKYADEEKIAEMLKSEGYGEEIYRKDLITLTDMKKLVGKETVERLEEAGLIIKPEGKPTLADEGDKRPEFKPTN